MQFVQEIIYTFRLTLQIQEDILYTAYKSSINWAMLSVKCEASFAVIIAIGHTTACVCNVTRKKLRTKYKIAVCRTEQEFG